MGYFFLLIGYDNIDWQGSSQVDVDGNWGGPYNKGNNNALKNLLLTDGDLQRQRRRRPGHGSQLQRLARRGQRHRVRPRRGHRRPAGPDRNRTQLYFNGPAGVADGDRGDVVIFSGVWDDGLVRLAADGIPDAARRSPAPA